MKRLPGTRGERDGEFVFNEYRVSVWNDGKVLVMVTQHYECTRCTESYT